MTPEHDLLRQVLPRYDIRHEIGRGGWGVVYEGWHRDLKRRVAIKQLPQAFGADPSVRDRFIAEAQLVASLEHPHIVPLFDFAERDGLYVIVMELATGSVWNRFEQHGLKSDEAVGTVLAAAVGLHYAHSRGLLHRDVKPDNLLYSASGTVKVADFGIAKSMNEAEGARTATNTVIGSPSYMAPEQIAAGELSAATDVYALGIVTYQLLSGQLPFAPVTELMAQLYQHVNEPPRPLGELAPHVPAPLAEVVHRAMNKDPADRPQSAEQFATELASAGTASFGPGWLERTGLAVMGSTAVIAATERASVAASVSGHTQVVRPDIAERHRVGQLQSVGGAAEAGAPEARAPEATASQDGSKRRFSLPMVGGIIAAIGAMAVVAVLLFGPWDDDGSPSVDTVTAGEQATFRTLCEANGVGAGRCGCALTRAVDQLDAELFRSNLAVMVGQDGALGPELNTIFQACVDDGF